LLLFYQSFLLLLQPLLLYFLHAGYPKSGGLEHLDLSVKVNMHMFDG